jgi:hypothetical protein
MHIRPSSGCGRGGKGTAGGGGGGERAGSSTPQGTLGVVNLTGIMKQAAG